MVKKEVSKKVYKRNYINIPSNDEEQKEKKKEKQPLDFVKLLEGLQDQSTKLPNNEAFKLKPGMRKDEHRQFVSTKIYFFIDNFLVGVDVSTL